MSSTIWEEIMQLRDVCRAVPGVQSVSIGIEDGISPADFPIVRIEPENYTPGRPYGNRTAIVNVVFGMPIVIAEGLTQVYREMHELEAKLLDALRESAKDADAPLRWRYLNTAWFERRDQVPYKMAALRGEITG